MPAPSSNPEWATDATYSSPGDAWDGANTKSDPAFRAQGFEPSQRPAADHVNYVLNAHGEWIEWIHSVYEYVTPVTKTLRVGAAEAFVPPTSQWVFSYTSYAWSSVGTANPLVFDITDLLPDGCVLQRVRVLVDPAGASAMTAYVSKRTVNLTAPSVGLISTVGSAASSGTALQTLSVGSLAETVDRSGNTTGEQIFVEVAAGQASDLVYQIEIQYDDPGPGHR